jgi:DNA-binding NarL/FixJ family response regulator
MKKINGFHPSQILTNREFEITKFLLDGTRTRDIANQLCLKPNTVSTIKKNIFIKLNVDSVIDLYKLLK